MSTVEEIIERINANSKSIITISENNSQLVHVIRQQAEDNLKLMKLNQAFFNDYVSVASELTNVPQSVIVRRVKEAAEDNSQQTNLFVVR